MSWGTTRYTAIGTTTIDSTNALSTGFQSSANGAMAKNPRVTSGKIASQVITARTWTDGGLGGAAFGLVCGDRDTVVPFDWERPHGCAATFTVPAVVAIPGIVLPKAGQTALLAE